MVLRELQSFIGEDFLSYQVINLHDERLLVDGDGVLLRLDELSRLSYLEIMNEAKSIINSFLRCRLDTIFVFSGVDERTGEALQSALYAEQMKLNSSALSQTTSTVFQVDGLAHIREILLSVLRQLQVKHVICSYDSVAPCAALASQLGCSVLAQNSDYYVVSLRSEGPTGDKSRQPSGYLPLSLLSLTPLSLNSENAIGVSSSSDCFMCAHMYYPENSVMGRVPAKSRPLFRALIGSPSIPFIPLPSGINKYCNVNTDSRDPRIARLIGWFSKQTSQQILASLLLEVSDPQQACTLARQLLEVVATLIPDPIEALHLTRALNLPENLHVLTQTNNSSYTGVGPWTPFAFFHQMSYILQMGDASGQRRMDFMAGWPLALVDAFRRGRLRTTILTAVYAVGGVLFTLDNPAVQLQPSTRLRSRILRHLQYCLLVGLELAGAQQAKLIGVQPHVIELLHNTNREFEAHFVPVRPLAVLPSYTADAFLEFLRQHLKFVPRPGMSKWSNYLALSMALYYRQKPPPPGILKQNTLVLAVCVVSVATYFNSEITGEDLLEHYSQVLDQANAETDSDGITVSANHLPASDLAFELTELQDVYAELLSLEGLVTALSQPISTTCVPDSECLPFWQVFPHAALTITLTRWLSNQKSNLRMNLASRLWLPRLFYPTKQQGVAERLKKAVTTFTDLICSMDTSLSWDSPKVVIKPLSKPSLPLSTSATDNRLPPTNLLYTTKPHNLTTSDSAHWHNGSAKGSVVEPTVSKKKVAKAGKTTTASATAAAVVSKPKPVKTRHLSVTTTSVTVNEIGKNAMPVRQKGSYARLLKQRFN